ncbi:MAG: M6 family metalloprotease domain-containing protein [Bacteroidetes bacterium]|nr:M6 family metalloprotease domain-containing protein [Bacteroidota bacterium]MCL1968303.1 M6 family metalloprotease domain-containing protein [Bacteroidota bacterium]
MKHFLSFIFIFSVFTRLLAVPAYPYPVVFTQPNGEEVTLIMQGDEFVKFAQTLDGYTLLYNAEGYFCYAQKNEQGDIVPSDFYATDISKRGASLSALLAKTPTNLRYSNNQMSIYRQLREMVENENRNSRGNTTGIRKLLVILMQFQDKLFIKTQEDFDNMFNQLKYTDYGANGSVKDFFLECSYNKLEVQTTVAGPFTATHNHAYYGSDSWMARELATEAVYAAHAAGINFANFAIDGEMPSFYMIFAGHGEEAGGGVNCIWSHAWSIDPVHLNGVWISSYACSPELSGGSGTNITRIGVICHEFGHSLGAPDYYDTNYEEDGQYQGTGTWELQASGSWNDNGRTPAPPNPRSKVYIYQWATATELNSAQTVTIPSSRIYDNAYFRINTPTTDEYYILENKIKEGYDEYIPGVNMMIYHCAANMDGMNTTSPQKFYPVAANAPIDLPRYGTTYSSDYGTVNSTSCPWPGTNGKTEFTNSTVPAMITWNRQNVNKPITNIAVHGDHITFDILGGGTKNNYIIFLPSYYGCTITPQPGYTSPVAAGGTFKFSITIAPSHSQSTIVVKANGATITSSGNIYTLSNIQSDQIVTIEGLQFNSVNITASAEENGTITPSGVVIVPIGNNQRFDISCSIGYSVKDILVDGTSVGPVTNYIFRDLTEPHTINATFKTGGIYTINTSITSASFETEMGKPSESVEAIISSSDVVTGINVNAPPKFQVSNNGTHWLQSFTIIKNQLPAKIYIRFNPSATDYGSFNDILTLKSISAYAEIALFGNSLGINEYEENITLFPNPTTGELRITNYELRIENVEIFDVYGKCHSSLVTRYEIGETVINISDLPAGLYFVKIYTQSGIQIKKIIKL